MKTALLGHGTVGKGVSKIIDENNSELECVRILVKDESECIDERCTTDFQQIINDEQIETVVEMMGGLHPAYEYVCKALNQKKHVVTSNKALMSTYYQELLDLAKVNHVKIAFEAAVCGGIPWLSNIVQTKQSDQILSFKGIVNGTTNFILDKMYHDNISFEEALQLAQQLGYAERDASMDIDGLDARAKCGLTANICWNTSVNIDHIDTASIRNFSNKDFAYSRQNQKVLKLLAEGVVKDDELILTVTPVFLSCDEMFAKVEANYNMTELVSSNLGTSRYYGQGAGQLPTAFAVVQNLLAINSKQYQNPTVERNYIINNDNCLAHYYLRTSNLTNYLAIIEHPIDEDSAITKLISCHEMMQLMQANTDQNYFLAKWEE